MSPVSEELSAGKVFTIDLERFLTELGHAGLDISIADRVAIKALAAELFGLEVITTLDDFKPYLKAVLARTPAHARLFAASNIAVEDSKIIGPAPYVVHDVPGADERLKQQQIVSDTSRRAVVSKWRIAGAFAAIVLVAMFGWAFRKDLTAILGGASPEVPLVASRLQGADASPPASATAVDQVELDGPEQTVARVLIAATSSSGAPTLSELAGALELNAALLVTPESAALALRELTGAPADRPLDLLGIGAEEGAIAWAPILARAVDRLERPGSVEPPRSYAISGEALDARAARIRSLLAPADDLTTPEGRAAARARLQEPEPSAWPRLDARLRALLAPDTLRKEDRAVWAGAQRSAASEWLAPAVAATPVALVVLWLVIQYFAERAYLRRRRPRRPPNRTEFVAEALASAFTWTPTDQRLAQILAARDEHETERLDVRQTIDASLALGGRLVVLKQERLRPAPEYLVLVEENRTGDPIAQRMCDLLLPYRKNTDLHFDIYTYQDTPTVLRSEDGATAQRLEAVRAKHPNHRLIILGTAHTFTAFQDGAPAPFVSTLLEWERRVVLTPQPLSEWGRREFMVASALGAPVGRATRTGFSLVGDLLGLVGPPPDPLPNPAGDGRLAELPESIRLDPHQLLYDDDIPPADIELDDLLRDLVFFLDRDGFRWLSALAVFPVIQWDITLYLGLRLPTERDLLFRRIDPTTAKSQKILVRDGEHRECCFRDDALGDRRLAALSRLPWLRNGFMPSWLREALIERLSDTDRGEIYRAIDEALERAENTAEYSGETDRRIRLRIGRDSSRGRALDYRPREDELLLDFLRRGDRGDYPLPLGFQDRFRRQSDRFLTSGRNQRLAAIAILTGVAAWFVAPSASTNPATGGWWPLVLVGLGAVVALAIEAILARSGDGWSAPPHVRLSWPKISLPWPSHTREQTSGGREARSYAAPAPPEPEILAPLSVFRDLLKDGSEGPDMVVIPAGRFLMGSPAEEQGRRSNEGPQHEVAVRSFALGQFPVTFDVYDAFCAATGRDKPDDRGWGRGQRPVINVSWNDASAYCVWLSEQTGAGYRLPSEAEWEYACRAGTRTRYSFGDDVGRLDEHAWFTSNSHGKPQPVGAKNRNAFGLYDMHGNVWEWCADVLNESYAGAPTDGSAWTSGDGSRAVLRGGSWDFGARFLRSAFRLWLRRDYRGDDVGFRLARTLPGD